MSEEFNEEAGSTDAEAIEELKKKLVDGASGGAAQASDDPTRSALHYGKEQGYNPFLDHLDNGIDVASVETAHDAVDDGTVQLKSTIDLSGASSDEPSPDPVHDRMADTEADRSVARDSEIGDARASVAMPGDQAPQSIADLEADAANADRSTNDAHASQNDPLSRGRGEPASDGKAPVGENDAGEGDTEQPDHVFNINDAPERIDLHGDLSLDENAAGAEIGRLSVTDPDAGDSHSFAVSDARFEVVDGAVKLKDGVSLDHEAEAQLDLTVTATDSGGVSLSQSFVIAVADVNEGPVALDLSGAALDENDAGAEIGRLSVTDPDAGDSHSFAVSDARFEVVDGAVKLKDGVSLDHEAEAQLDLTVTATDSGGASLSQSFVIAVADVNEGPVALELSGAALDENAAGAEIGRLSVTDPDAGDSHSFAVSDARFEVVDGAVKLKDGVSLDHEAEAELELTVTATDSGGASLSQSFVIAVADVNEGPVALELSGAALDENAAGAEIGRLSVTDPDAGDSHSFAVSDARFEVVDGAVKLKDGVSLDHEAEAQLDLTVTATDSGGASLSQSFVIAVADVNEGPVALELSGAALDENAAGAEIGRLSVTDPDAGDSHSFAVSDARFEVVDGAVKLKDGVSLDHEAEAELDLTVTATDSGGASLSQSFVIAVADVNEGPVALDLSGAALEENAAGAAIGRLSVTDPDAGDSHSFAVSDARFEVVDGAVKLKDGVSLDHEAEAELDLTVTATDSGGASLSQSFVIAVADVNEGPVALDLSGAALDENAAGAEIGRLSVTDPDAGDSHSFAVSDARFEVVDGAVKLKDGVSLDHEAEAELDLTVTATDSGGVSLSQSFVIAVADVNEGPVALDLSGAALDENDAGAEIGRLSVTDPDAGDSHSFAVSDARFEVVDGAVKLKDGVSLDHEAEAQLDLTVTATDSGGASLSQSFVIAVADVNEGPVALDLSGAALDENAAGAEIGRLSVTDPDAGDSHSFAVSDARFEVVDGAVKLKDGVSLDHEAEAELDLTVTATDSGGASLSQSFVIAVADVNEGPVALELSGAALDENAAGAEIGRLSVTDPDAGDSHSFAVSDARFEVVDGAVKLKDGVSLDHEAEAQLELTVTATDSGGASLSQSFVIAVADVNEGPVALELSGAALDENAAGAEIGRLSVTDPDAGDSHSFAVSDARFEVVDGAVKLKDGVSLDHEAEAQLELTVTATDSGGASLSQSFVIAVADVAETRINSGFEASYFDMNRGVRELNDVNWDAAPTHQEVVSDINYTNSAGSFWDGGSTDTFAARMTGNFEVTNAGSFDFFVGADDGAALFVNGVRVVDNDGVHAFQTGSGSIELEPGTHVVEVRYFENYEHAGLTVEWSGPGIDGRELLTAPVDDLQTVNGMPLTISIELDGADTGAARHAIEGLPPGTTVQGGEATAEIGPDGTLDITGWETDVLSITPPVDFTGAVEAVVTTTIKAGSGQVSTSQTPLEFSVNDAQVTPPEMEIGTGFHAEYFDVNHRLRKIGDIDWDSEPTHEELVGEINYENGRGSFWEGGSRDTFGARISGDIMVEEGGVYDFFVGADDGVVLFINGEEVIDNDGLHGFRTRSGEVELEPGRHEIEVRYFENYGHAGLKLEWSGPDTDGRELVTASPELGMDENGATEFQIATDATGGVTISGLPPDTILISGDDTAVSDGSAIDVSDWDLDLIEFMPPADFAGEITATVQVHDTAFNGQRVTTETELSIQVGEPVEVARGAALEHQMLMAEDGGNKAEGGGWDLAETDADPDTKGENDDEAMREPVETKTEAEQSSDGSDTFGHHEF